MLGAGWLHLGFLRGRQCADVEAGVAHVSLVTKVNVCAAGRKEETEDGEKSERDATVSE